MGRRRRFHAFTGHRVQYTPDWKIYGVPGYKPTESSLDESLDSAVYLVTGSPFVSLKAVTSTGSPDRRLTSLWAVPSTATPARLATSRWTVPSIGSPARGVKRLILCWKRVIPNPGRLNSWRFESGPLQAMIFEV